MKAIGNYTSGIISAVLGQQKYNNKAYYPEECPLVSTGILCEHRFHCTDDSSRQMASTLNGIADLIIVADRNVDRLITELNDNVLTVNENLDIDAKSIFNKINQISKKLDNVNNTKPTSKSKGKEVDNTDLLLTISEEIDNIRKDQAAMHEKIAKQMQTLFYGHTKDVTSKVTALGKEVTVSNNTTLMGIRDDLEKLIMDMKYDPNNPKPIELRIESNANDILRLNKKVTPIMESSNEAIIKANVLLNDVQLTLEQVKKKLGLYDD